RQKTPRRWILKDLAGLYFSSMDIGLTTRDLLRFVKNYNRLNLSDGFRREKAFWSDVVKGAVRLYMKIHKRAPKAVVLR
ncbi:MAG: hypothetical protein OET90_11480, partial [Desulfuromonadales bacterium]|nr:hypothetical protein [Desulfuromonadales bacterium]